MTLDLQKYFNQFKNECDWLSFRLVNEDNKSFSSRDGKPSGHHNSFDHGLMMEVVVDGRLAYTATSDLTPAGIERAFKKGLTLAKDLKGITLTEFNPSLRGNAKANSIMSEAKTLDNLDIKELVDFQLKLGTDLKNAPNALSSWVVNTLIRTRTMYLNSNGAEIDQLTSIISQGMGVTGAKNGVIQNRTDSGYFARSMQGGLSILDFHKQAERANNIVKEMNELLDAPDCPSDNRSLLLSSDQMMLQIHESIGHPLELDRILGDERNYAGWSFIKPEDFGNLKYGSPLMNVSFDPTLKGEIASYAYDDGGVEASKVFLIKDGLLLAGLGATESQERLGLKGVSNFRAQSWNRAPIDRMANINLEPGNSSFDEMVKNTEKGVYMQTNRSWSIDDYRNKFQFGCEYGRLIEDGELKGVVKNPNYRGITVNFWNNLQSVGDQSTFEIYGTPHCGKGEPNQVVRVGHASPTCLFKNIDVFGGA
jgi:predicted Zn-dependent protease